MKSLKKSVIFLMVFAMVLSTVAPVFAATTPSDVVGTNYEAAVGMLTNLGVISGYEDGTFKPDQNITRAEFAKIACYVVGAKDAAVLAAGTTKFKDVPATHWASGFINVASEKGLIKGYTDGTFKPEANVTYAEAITILVRALGMGQVVEGVGTWPANYLAKASSAGITDEVDGLTANGAAVRGAIAQLAWNTLGAEEWGEKEYTSTGITYGPLGKALIKDVYGDNAYKNSNGDYVPKEFKDVTVIGTQGVTAGLDNDEINVKVTDQADLAALIGDTTDPATLKVLDPKAVDLNSLFGKKVDLLLGKDNKVAFIKPSSEDVVAGTISDFDTASDNPTITVNGKDYLFKSDVIAYLNGVVESDSFKTKAAFGTLKTNIIKNSTVNAQLVLDGGRVSYANLTTCDSIPGLGVTALKQGVVKQIKSNGDVLDVTDAKMFDLDDVTSDSKQSIITKDGKPATAADLKVGDAVTYELNGGVYTLNISDNKVTGTVSKVSIDTDANSTSANGAVAHQTRYKFTIDGKVYYMVNDGTVTMTKTGNVDDEVPVDSSTSNFAGQSATLTLNAVGEIVFINGKTTSSATMQVGVVTKTLTADGSGYDIKILTPSGVATSYVTTGDSYYDLVASGATTLDSSDANKRDFDNLGLGVISGKNNNDLAKGAIVAYDVSSDGKIDGSDLFVIDGCSISDGDLKVVAVTGDAGTAVTAVDKSQKLSVAATGKTYYANSSTTYLNANTSNIENIDGWSSLVNSSNATRLDNAGVVSYIVYDSDYIIKEVVTNIASALYYTTSADYGIFEDAYNTGSDKYITLYIDGAAKDYKTSGTIASGTYEAGDLVQFDTDGDGKFVVGDGVNRADRSALQDLSKTTAGDVYCVDKFNATDRILTFKDDDRRYDNSTGDAHPGYTETTETSLKIAADAVVYNVIDDTNITKGSLSDITAGSYVTVDDYKSDDDDYEVVVIFN